MIAFAAPAAASSMKDNHHGHRCSGHGHFKGAYIGASIGYAQSQYEHQASAAVRGDGEEGGFVGGGHVGYNWQCDRFVFGIEADFNYFAGDDYSERYVSGGETVSLKSHLSFFGTVRGRIGIAHDHIMFYGTGGLAYARISDEVSYNCGTCFNFNQDDDEFKVGWTVGAGIEIEHDHRWLLRAEALYVDLGKHEQDYTFTGTCVSCAARVDYDNSFWALRVGVSVKLQRPHHDKPYK